MTKQAQHTPGPWVYLPDANMVGAPGTWHDEDGAHFDLRYPRVIAELPDDWDQAMHGRLIAEVPVMLAEIRQLLANASYQDGQAICLTQDCEALEAILARIDGGSAQ